MQGKVRLKKAALALVRDYACCTLLQAARPHTTRTCHVDERHKEKGSVRCQPVKDSIGVCIRTGSPVIRRPK